MCSSFNMSQGGLEVELNSLISLKFMTRIEEMLSKNGFFITRGRRSLINMLTHSSKHLAPAFPDVGEQSKH